jgi:hypothetical protein
MRINSDTWTQNRNFIEEISSHFEWFYDDITNDLHSYLKLNVYIILLSIYHYLLKLKFSQFIN